MTPARIRVFSVDDHPLLRERIAAVIDNEPDMTMVAQAAGGREAIQQFAVQRPDVTLHAGKKRVSPDVAAALAEHVSDER
jgi:chemotaxis response regulator CheB